MWHNPAMPLRSSIDPEKNPHAVAMGKLGGPKGGKARAESLTPERRQSIARKAAKARWKKVAEDRANG